jgi:hypothetical protein
MAGVNIGNVGLTFTNYLSDVVESLNHASKARTYARQKKKWAGANLEGRLHTARSTAIGYVEDGGAFPVADKQDYAAWKAYRKFVVGSIQLTDGVMATAAKSRHVARDVITSEVKGLMKNILKFENGFFFKNGDGSVATVQTGTSGSSTTTLVDDARMLWDGGVFQVYDSTLATNRGNVTISKVASAPTAAGYATVTTSNNNPSGTIATDKLVWNGSVNRAITGLSKLVDNTSTTFQNINTANYPHYVSLVLSNSGTARELTPALFRQMLAGIKQKSGDERPAQGLTVLTSAWDAINVEELYEGELRLTPASKTAGLAVAAFQSALGRVDIMSDSDAPYGKMFFVDFSKIYRAVQKQLGWRRQGGSIFKRSDVAGVWTATAIEICELFIKERHTSGRLDDLTNDIKTMY